MSYGLQEEGQCFPNEFAFLSHLALGVSRASPFLCCKRVIKSKGEKVSQQ